MQRITYGIDAAKMFNTLTKIYTEAINECGIMNDARNPPIVKSAEKLS